MEQLLQQYSDSLPQPKVGDLVKGKVISMGQNEVHLDVDGLWTGIIRGPELNDESGENSKLKLNDEVEATVLDLENEQGTLELSFRFAGHKKAWEELARTRDNGEVVEIKIIDANKGGLMIRLGRVTGFLPVSQLTVEHYPRVEGGNKNRILERLKEFIGQTFRVKVITVDEADSKLIVSERAAWEEKQVEALSKIKIDDIVEGRVSGIVDFGVFLEFGEGLEGLLHISELAWQRIDDPSDYVKVGQMIKAQIIAIEEGKISLSAKRLIPDPWKNMKYAVGDVVKGKVLKINPFGVFVELDRDIHGLAHISELSAKKIQDPTEIVHPMEEREFKIISMDPRHHRLGLSIRALKKATKGAEEAEADEKEEKVDESGEQPTSGEAKVSEPDLTPPAATEAPETPEEKNEAEGSLS